MYEMKNYANHHFQLNSFKLLITLLQWSIVLFI